MLRVISVVICILLQIFVNNVVVVGKLYNKPINAILSNPTPVCMHRAFFSPRDGDKIKDPQLYKNNGSPKNKLNLPKVLNNDTRKLIVIAGTTALATAVCYKYVSKMINHYLYDQYITNDAPGISEILGHVLYTNVKDDTPLKTSALDKIINIITTSLMKIGWIRAIYKPGIKRIPIGEAIDDDTITAVYFHSAKIDKILKEQGFAPFTDKLKKVYESLKGNGKKFQVVYISLDGNGIDSYDHFKNMPWYSLPFNDSKRVMDLCRLYDIMSVPSIILLDSDGNIINDRALYLILNKPNDYPWKVDNVLNLIPNNLMNINNELITLDKLNNKIIGLYFNGGWTKDNNEFSNKLLNYYNNLNKKINNKFEIIYVSNDKNNNTFDIEINNNNSNWLYIPFNDIQSRNLLQHYFNVTSLPSLVLIDPYGNIITKDGKFYVETDVNADNLPFDDYLHNNKTLVEDITNNIDGFAHHPSIIAFTDNFTPQEQQIIETQLNDAAKLHLQHRKGKLIKFFISKTPHKRTTAIKTLCGVNNNQPKIVCIYPLNEIVTCCFYPRSNYCLLHLLSSCRQLF